MGAWPRRTRDKLSFVDLPADESNSIFSTVPNCTCRISIEPRPLKTFLTSNVNFAIWPFPFFEWMSPKQTQGIQNVEHDENDAGEKINDFKTAISRLEELQKFSVTLSKAI